MLGTLIIDDDWVLCLSPPRRKSSRACFPLWKSAGSLRNTECKLRPATACETHSKLVFVTCIDSQVFCIPSATGTSLFCIVHARTLPSLLNTVGTRNTRAIAVARCRCNDPCILLDLLKLRKSVTVEVSSIELIEAPLLEKNMKRTDFRFK